MKRIPQQRWVWGRGTVIRKRVGGFKTPEYHKRNIGVTKPSFSCRKFNPYFRKLPFIININRGNDVLWNGWSWNRKRINATRAMTSSWQMAIYRRRCRWWP